MKANNTPRKSILIAQSNEDEHSMSKLRSLIFDLLNELELLDQPRAAMKESSLTRADNQISFFEEVSRFEIALIINALERTHGRQVQAARLLDLKVSTLNMKIKRYGIKPRACAYQPTTASVSAITKRTRQST